MAKRFVHREHQPSDPTFLREEREFLNRERSAMRLMHLHRDQLASDIDRCKSLAKHARIPLEPPEVADQPQITLVGVGHAGRGDDAAGIEVARRVGSSNPPGLKVLEEDSDLISLVQTWATGDDAVVIAATSSGAAPGTVRHLVISRDRDSEEEIRGWAGEEIAETLEFARTVDRMPRRVTIYGIEGQSFDRGEDLSEPVGAAVNRLATVLSRELSQAERIVLPGGSELLIRPIRAADREAFLRAFEHLSEETRYKRFLGPIRRLTEDQVTYFTEVDHQDHEALVALTPAGEIVGVARYIRLPDVPGAAEVAVTVTDDWQHRGVGYALVERLVRRARGAGVESFRAICLSSNADIQQLLREFSSDARTRHPEPGLVELDTTLPPEREHSPWVQRALRLAAHAYHGTPPP
jgi:hydrogenase maturation protease